MKIWQPVDLIHRQGLYLLCRWSMSFAGRRVLPVPVRPCHAIPWTTGQLFAFTTFSRFSFLEPVQKDLYEHVDLGSFRVCIWYLGTRADDALRGFVTDIFRRGLSHTYITFCT